VLGVGLVAFYFFARSNHRLSRKEASILLGFYLCFLFAQLFNIGRLSA
jgi:Ca2+/Na+ antiporter